MAIKASEPEKTVADVVEETKAAEAVEASGDPEGWVEVVFVGQGRVRCADGTKIGKGESGPMTEDDALAHAEAGNVKLVK